MTLRVTLLPFRVTVHVTPRRYAEHMKGGRAAVRMSERRYADGESGGE
jgi:hypothetical protein